MFETVTWRHPHRDRLWHRLRLDLCFDLRCRQRNGRRQCHCAIRSQHGLRHLARRPVRCRNHNTRVDSRTRMSRHSIDDGCAAEDLHDPCREACMDKLLCDVGVSS